MPSRTRYLRSSKTVVALASATAGMIVVGLLAGWWSRSAPPVAGQAPVVSMPLSPEVAARLGGILSRIDDLAPSKPPTAQAERLRREGDAAWHAKDFATAADRFTATLEIRRRLAGLTPGDDAARLAWAEAEYLVALTQARLRRDDLALAGLRRGLAVLSHSPDGHARRRLACLLHSLGDLLDVDRDHHRTEASRELAELEARGEVQGDPALESIRERLSSNLP